ncbi:MAG: pirin family protein [Sulfurospirillaceae bacterium]|nr:pirin family protein [Sulfurospirillaceae bacterium]MDD2826087.1 pirin family protein [Sulfurospirillaceae bacterium]
MLTKRTKDSLYLAEHGWLTSRFHFSFAEYHNPNNMHFGALRVLNDDLILPKTGFDTHSHRDMEIVSYVVNGEITHKDSMGNAKVLKRGEVQYMSAGTGIYHSEHNRHESDSLRLLQMWFLPTSTHLTPVYGDKHYTKEERHNTLLHIVSSYQGDAAIKINQDVNLYVTELDKGLHVNVSIQPQRQVYLVQIEGSCLVNTIELHQGDALEVIQEKHLKIEALSDAHILVIDLAVEGYAS